jgi:hypothetical protein
MASFARMVPFFIEMLRIVGIKWKQFRYTRCFYFIYIIHCCSFACERLSMPHVHRFQLILLLIAYAMAGVLLYLIYTPAPASSEPLRSATSGRLPIEQFLPIAPTLPNERLNFTDDSQNSCCAHDYAADGQPLPSSPTPATMGDASPAGNSRPAIVTTEFERVNPSHVLAGPANVPVSCNRLADLPQAVSNGSTNAYPNAEALPIAPYSTNVSRRPGAIFKTEPDAHNVSDFHIEVSGGDSRIALQDVNGYSVCMARGQNEMMVGNTDNGSIMAYNGDDRILLAGNNTNMFTRTGAGEDTIELLQAEIAKTSPEKSGPMAEWHAYQIYKTAISGGDGTDRLIIRETPFGTKWCYIGVYRIYGETFHVIEFALPPTVTSGPRRQRVNIGESIEYITIKGRTYTRQDFLSHGSPADTVAKRIPLEADLPANMGSL